jgi:hypothetical protein
MNFIQKSSRPSLGFQFIDGLFDIIRNSYVCIVLLLIKEVVNEIFLVTVIFLGLNLLDALKKLGRSLLSQGFELFA